MNKLRLFAAMSAATLLAACTGGQAVSPPVSSAGGGNVTSSSYSTLQFAVGTANIAGQAGLNTVVTFRQNNGLSAVGYSTPSITWDGAFTNTSAAQFDKTQIGPNVDDGKPQITGSALPQAGVKPPTSTFGGSNSGALGFSWGAFGYGFNPSNSAANGGPNALQYPCLPVYAATAPGLAAGSPGCNAASNPSFTFADLAADGAMYVGGPPAFPQIRGAALSGQLGAYLGFIPFAGLTPAPNATTGKSTFALNVAVPTAGGTQTATAAATMTNFAQLGTFATPTFTPVATGGGTVNYVLPAGVTEAYIEVVNWGPKGTGGFNCNFGAGGAPFYYTIRVTGGTSAVLADNTAAATAAGVTDPAAGDQYQVYAVGFDYPAFGASYPSSNGNPKPAIANAAGQADITMSDLGAVTPTGF